MTTPAFSLPGQQIRHDVSTLLSRYWEVRVPKWVDAVEAIRADIAAGKHEKKLPSYQKLQADYGFGDATIRRAIAELEAEGLVRRRHGFGVEVIRVPDSASTPRTFAERLDDHERRLRALEEGK